MLQYRVMPCLLLKETGLVKTKQFQDPVYLGDPLNIVRIFNDKEVDEMILLDITATTEKKSPNFKLIQEIASECFMPLVYGGGVTDLEQVRKILRSGVEKVSLNSNALEDLKLVREASKEFGAQAIVVSVDIKKNWLGKYTIHARTKSPKFSDPIEFVKRAEEAGAGEFVVTSVDRDGMMNGFDLKLVEMISSKVSVPVIACGGAKSVQDLVDVVQKGKASAAAAGSMFVFHGPLRGVLINFPSRTVLDQAFGVASSQSSRSKEM